MTSSLACAGLSRVHPRSALDVNRRVRARAHRTVPLVRSHVTRARHHRELRLQRVDRPAGRSSGSAGRVPTRASSSARCSIATGAGPSPSRVRRARRRVRQEYVENTNVLRTTFAGEAGLVRADRLRAALPPVRPSVQAARSLVRILRPLAGDPRVRVRCRPIGDYGRATVAVVAGVEPHRVHRPACTAPADDERAAHLRRGRAARSCSSATATSSSPRAAARGRARGDRRAFLERTLAYWRQWVKRTRVPRDYQARGDPLGARAQAAPVRGHGRAPRGDDDEPSRASRLGPHVGLPLLLAPRRVLHAQRPRAARPPGRDGAVPHLPPERRRGERRHAAACVHDHRRRGGARGDPRSPRRLRRVRPRAHRQPGVAARPERRVRRDDPRRLPAPPRRALRRRHDARRRPSHSSAASSTRSSARLDEPDAGLWELRGVRKLHSFTRAHALGGRERGGRDRAGTRPRGSHRARDDGRGRGGRLLESAAGATSSARSPRPPASRRSTRRCSSPCTSASSVRTIRAPRPTSTRSGPISRCPRDCCDATASQDDFGEPEAAFTVCSFWLVEALALLGRRDEATALFEKLLTLDNGLGLYSEDILPDTLEQSGNFPQTYSHVGLINAAFRLSRTWD